MDNISVLHLLRPNMGTPVQMNVRLDGAPTGQPGVTALVSCRQGLGWCVLADHPLNHGVSVTNGAELYAEAVCRALEVDMADLAWFELDSEGRFDALQLLGGVSFQPVLEDGHPPRSLDALVARLTRLRGTPSPSTIETLAMMAARFQQ